MRKLTALLLYSIFSLSSLAQNDTSLIPRHDFTNPNNAWDVKVNADGTRLVYEAQHQGDKVLMLAKTSSPQQAKALKLGKDFNFTSFQWSNNPNYLIIYADHFGDERWQLLSVNVSNNSVNALTPGEGERASIIGMSLAQSNLITVAHNQRDKAYVDLYQVDIVSGKSQLIFKNEQGFAEFYADLQGRPRLAVTREAETDAFTITAINDKDSKSVLSIGFEDTRNFAFIGFELDGNSFYILDSTGRDKSALVKVDNKTMRREVLAQSSLADIQEVVVIPKTGQPIAYAVDYLSRDWVSLATKHTSLFKRLSQDFQGRVDIISSTLDGNMLTAYVSGKSASYYVLIDSTSGEVSKVVDAYPSLKSYHFTEKVPFSMKTRDGQTLVGTFVAAHGSDQDGDGFPDKPTPLIVMAHGGPWDQSKPGFDTWQQWLANRGYSVISPNFRASTGLGKHWLNAGNKQWGGDITNDVVDSIDWAIAKGYAMKDKIGSMGASFGGYISLQLLTNYPEKLACGISTAASPNLISLYHSLPDYWAAFKNEYRFRVGDVTTEQGRNLLKEHSPLFKAKSITKPTLIFHAVNDSRVNIDEPRQIVAAMKQNDIPVTFGVFKQAGHVYASEEATLLYQAIAEMFFAKCLGGKVEPYSKTIDESVFSFEAGGEFFVQ
ncbi:alpha/beta hydrolase family protein [Thalassotalea ganghwensis]